MTASSFADTDVTAVEVLGHYRLRLTFADGLRGDVDVSDLADLPGDLVAPLRDPAYFSLARVDPDEGTVIWPNGVDLAAERLHEEASLHPVTEHARPSWLRWTSRPARIFLVGHSDVLAPPEARPFEDSFAAFADSERPTVLVSLLSSQAGLPAEESKSLIQLALTEAEHRWDEPAVRANPAEWVLGSAVQLQRNPLKELPRLTPADVRVTGALAVAASAAPVSEPVPAARAETKDVSWRDEALTALYVTHYRPLVRLTALLVRDIGTSEEIVQDAFAALPTRGNDVPGDNARALALLRRYVVQRSRPLEAAQAVDPQARAAHTEVHDVTALLERSAVIAALRQLPARQREAMVLRFYADLSDAEIANAMEISRGAVRSHIARALRAIRITLERSTSDPPPILPPQA